MSRCGILTASRFADATDYTKGGKESAALTGYRSELVVERVTGTPTHFFETYDMRWGTEHEADARQAYIEVTGNQVECRGLGISSEIQYFGASPDGLIGEHGGVEIKCPTSATFLKWVLDGAAPEQHKPQMLACMAVTGRRWWDFVAYDPRYPGERDLFIRRFEPPVYEIQAAKEQARVFLASVDAMMMKFLTARMI